jgi:hypothetical protein
MDHMTDNRDGYISAVRHREVLFGARLWAFAAGLAAGVPVTLVGLQIFEVLYVRHPWWVSFGLICLVLLVGVIIATRRGSRGP